MRLLPAADRVRSRWLNGAGSVVEVARDGGEAFLWRISIATVEGSSEFSAYPGVDRMLMPLSAGGIGLEVDGAGIHLPEGAVLAFAGEQSVRCLASTATTDDLNLMVRRGAATGSLARVVLDGALSVGGRGVVAVVVLEGAVFHEGGALQHRDALLLEAGESARLRGTGILAIASIITVAPAAVKSPPEAPLPV